VQARAKRIAVGLQNPPGFGRKAEPSQSNRSSPRCLYYRPDQSRPTQHGNCTSPDVTRTDARCLGASVVSSGTLGYITLRSTGRLAFPNQRRIAADVVGRI
jgi:hypothetical protein